jgi:DNA-binding transcriptional LysR family regulator
MRREELVDLNAFLTVAEEESFTRAAAKLGTSQSSLSHTIRRLEAKLGVRLLTRTTRSVATTEAGERLLGTLRPALDSIGAQLASLSELREKPAGTIRITTSEHAAHTVLWPTLERLLPNYPDVHVELSIDSSLTDIVTERFDAGVRLGEALAKDMIAVRIGPAHGGGRFACVFHKTANSTHAARSRRTSMHKSALIERRRALHLGPRKGWARGTGPCRRAAHLKQREYDRPRSRRRIRARLRYGRSYPGASRERTPGQSARGLVSVVSGISPLLHESARTVGCLCVVGRGAAF